MYKMNPKWHQCVNTVLPCLNKFITSLANPCYACNKLGYKLATFLSKVHLKSHHVAATPDCHVHICCQDDFPCATFRDFQFRLHNLLIHFGVNL